MDLRLRLAAPADAAAVAALHAESWRRNYRGAYADAFLDGDVLADRLAVWSARLRSEDSRERTILAEGTGPASGTLVGFAHVVFEHDPHWGALLDNIHVAHAHRRLGIGSSLLAYVAAAVGDRVPRTGFYLWVLEQNAAAQAFYEAHGGQCVQAAAVEPPGGVPGRLHGSPRKLRYAWDAAEEA
jgi:ribosomal protein S18 acetylase RimI-like enzyme